MTRRTPAKTAEDQLYAICAVVEQQVFAAPSEVSREAEGVGKDP